MKDKTKQLILKLKENVSEKELMRKVVEGVVMIEDDFWEIRQAWLKEGQPRSVLNLKKENYKQLVNFLKVSGIPFIKGENIIVAGPAFTEDFESLQNDGKSLIF